MKNKETLEERKPYWNLVDIKAEQNNTIDLNAYANGVEDGVKWQQERMYSEEEVLKILYDWSMYKIEFELGNLSADELVNEFNDILPYDEWFKQNKKK